MAFTPVDIFDAFASDIGLFGTKVVTNHKCIGQFNKPRLWEYNGAIYSIVFDNLGDTDPNNYLDPDYQRECWHAVKSTNQGTTWAEFPQANYFPVGGLSFYVSGGGCSVSRVGDVLWLFFTYGEEIAPGFTTKTNWIYAVPFNMATETWGSIVTAGAPSCGPFSVFILPPGLVSDSCYRGGNEVIVYHQETDASRLEGVGNTERAMYSIFNTSSQTWSSVSTVVFELTVAGSAFPASCVFDGTYVHFTAIAGDYFSSDSYKPHRTLNSSNALGTVSDMLVGYDAGWRPKNTSVGFLDNLLVFGGEVFCCEKYTGHSAYGAPYFHSKILVMQCPAGVQNPTWTVEDIESTAWETPDFDGDSETPLLVESGGDLYCIAAGRILGFPGFDPTETQYSLYSQKYLGGGAWDVPVLFWDYRISLGFVGAGGNIVPDELYDIAAIGNLTGTGIAGIGVTASFDTDAMSNLNRTVYWFRSIDNPCCCADYAY